MATPKGVLKLIERFECNRDAYRSHAYNETQARREFFDPLFKALSWERHRLAQSQKPHVSQHRTQGTTLQNQHDPVASGPVPDVED